MKAKPLFILCMFLSVMVFAQTVEFKVITFSPGVMIDSTPASLGLHEQRGVWIETSEQTPDHGCVVSAGRDPKRCEQVLLSMRHVSPDGI
jgi:hypothetical protein